MVLPRSLCLSVSRFSQESYGRVSTDSFSLRQGKITDSGNNPDHIPKHGQGMSLADSRDTQELR